MSVLRVTDGAAVSGASWDCLPGQVEQRFGVAGCRKEGRLLRSVAVTGAWMDGVGGGRQAGALGVQFDHVMGEALYAAAPPDHWALTTELGFDLVRPADWDSETLHATAWVVDSGAKGGFAQAELTDDSGKALAAGSTWVQYVPVQSAGTRFEPEGGSAARPAPNFVEHLGVRMWSTGDDRSVELREPALWTNEYGVLHGGVWAGLVELAARDVFADRGMHTAHVHVSYLRPAALGGPVSAAARPVHVGRSFGVVEVTGADGSGRRCVVATVTGRRDR